MSGIDGLTAELVLETLAAESGHEGWVPYYDVYYALEERRFDLDTRQLDKLDRLYKALFKQGLVESELRGQDLYERDLCFRLTNKGRDRVTEIEEADVRPETPLSTVGPRQRVSALAERVLTSGAL